MKDFLPWIAWTVVAAVIFFGGWIIKDSGSPTAGRALMSLGFLLAGFLVIFFAYKNLSGHDFRQQEKDKKDAEENS